MPPAAMMPRNGATAAPFLPWLAPAAMPWLARNGTTASGPATPPAEAPRQDHAAAVSLGAAGLLAITLALPTELRLQAGPLRLSAYRVVLLLAFLPALRCWLRGAAGPRRGPDFLFAGFAVWCVAALAANHGLGTAVESGGILVVETFGAYLVGRTCIRDAASFRALVSRLETVGTAVLLLALPETLTGYRLVHATCGALLGGAPDIVVEPRFGLHRAFGPFDHPILNGVFGSSLVALAAANAAAGAGAAAAWRRAGTMAAAALTSLSSAAMLATALQAGLLAWQRLTSGWRHRWWLLAGLLFAAYAVIGAGSSRSGLQALTWYLTFDRQTAAYRMLIWEHGASNVSANPWFGLGQGDWERPEWMSASIDSFWLVTTIAYGLPATVLLASAMLLAMVRAGRAVAAGDPAAQLRRAWVFALLATAFCGFTVHYWNSVFTMLGFLLGAGMWMERTGAGGRHGR